MENLHENRMLNNIMNKILEVDRFVFGRMENQKELILEVPLWIYEFIHKDQTGATFKPDCGCNKCGFTWRAAGINRNTVKVRLAKGRRYCCITFCKCGLRHEFTI